MSNWKDSPLGKETYKVNIVQKEIGSIYIKSSHLYSYKVCFFLFFFFLTEFAIFFVSQSMLKSVNPVCKTVLLYCRYTCWSSCLECLLFAYLTLYSLALGSTDIFSRKSSPTPMGCQYNYYKLKLNI